MCRGVAAALGRARRPSGRPRRPPSALPACRCRLPTLLGGYPFRSAAYFGWSDPGKVAYLVALMFHQPARYPLNRLETQGFGSLGPRHCVRFAPARRGSDHPNRVAGL